MSASSLVASLAFSPMPNSYGLVLLVLETTSRFGPPLLNGSRHIIPCNWPTWISELTLTSGARDPSWWSTALFNMSLSYSAQASPPSTSLNSKIHSSTARLRCPARTVSNPRLSPPNVPQTFEFQPLGPPPSPITSPTTHDSRLTSKATSTCSCSSHPPPLPQTTEYM